MCVGIAPLSGSRVAASLGRAACRSSTQVPARDPRHPRARSRDTHRQRVSLHGRDGFASSHRIASPSVKPSALISITACSRVSVGRLLSPTRATAISRDDVVKRGEAAFICVCHDMNMGSHQAVGNRQAKGRRRTHRSVTLAPRWGFSFGSPNTTLAAVRQWVLDSSMCALQEVPIGSLWEEEAMPFNGTGYEGRINALDKMDK
jgi:hypothetical protein